MNRQTFRSVFQPARGATRVALLLGLALVAGRAAVAQDSKTDAPAVKPAANTGAAAKAPAADDKLILPFIGEETFIVGRIDVGRIDVDAIEEYMNKMMEEMVKSMGGALPPQAVQQMKAQMAEPMKRFREGLVEFTGAGGHYVYVLMDTANVQDGEPLLVTPLGEGADPVKLGDLLSEMGGGGDVETAEVGKALVFGTHSQVEGIKQRVEAAGGKPVAGGERTDLAKAFAAGGTEAPLRIALLPGEAARAFMEEHHATLPEEIGGGDIKLISRGVRWATAGITQKPTIAVNLTVQASDAQSAKGLMELFAKTTDFVKGQPGAPPAMTAKLAELKPKLQGETITLTVDVAALQMGMFAGIRAEGQIGAEVAEPAKPDDGGL